MNEHDWLSRIAPEEKLLWHGKPTGRYPVTGFGKVFSALAALGILIGLGLLAYDLTLGKTSDLPRGPVTALVFLALGGGLQFSGRYGHRNAIYALTNKRAFVGMRWPFWAQIKAYEISRHTSIQYTKRDPATIFFARSNGGGLGSVKTGIGFRNIADGDEVYKFLMFAQKYAKPEGVYV